MEEAEVFQAPDDLRCPITHSLFHDPVITMAGSIYERSAILEHLQDSSRDPLTGSDLPSVQLTPVFLLKSRAREYAERAIRAAIEQAVMQDCPDPVRWLRRAVDLCDESGVRVSELTEACIEFTTKHRSSLHDTSVLLTFAHGLVERSHPAAALHLYCNMLRLDSDRRAQTAVLKRCLPCCLAQCPPGDTDAQVTALVVLILQQQALHPADLIDILQALALPVPMLLQVSRRLLVEEAKHMGGGSEDKAASASTSTLLLTKYLELADAETMRTVDAHHAVQHEQIESLERQIATMALPEAVHGVRGFWANVRGMRRVKRLATALALLGIGLRGAAGRACLAVPILIILTDTRLPPQRSASTPALQG